MAKQGSNWQKMNYDILLKIFMALNIIDIVSGVSQVCRSWRYACHAPILWETVDLNRLQCNAFDILPPEPYGSLDNSSSWWSVMLILTKASIFSGNNVPQLIFNYSMYIKDDHLVYAATRFPNIKYLALPPCNQITVEGFRAAIQRWKELECLIVPHISNPSSIMQVIGAHCKNFSKLKVMFPFGLDFATSLFINIPELKVLSLRSSVVDKHALTFILMLMDDLEALNIAHRWLVDVPRIPGPPRACQQPDNSIVEKASQLKEFFTCQEHSCSICQYQYTDENIFRWYEYDEALRREDEIISLGFCCEHVETAAYGYQAYWHPYYIYNNRQVD